jgi:hypothetical protein
VIRLRRRPKEVDWQADLAARSVVISTRDRAGKVSWRRVRRLTWRVLAGVCAVAVVGGEFLYYESEHQHVAVTALVAGFCVVAVAPQVVARLLRYLWRKWHPPLTVFEADGDVRGRIRYQLRQASLELREMLVEPTERGV